jgi:hypothetical protein
MAAFSSLPIRTSYAEMDVPLALVRHVALGNDHRTVFLEMAKGDRLTGVLKIDEIELASAFGKAVIGTEHVCSVQVSMSTEVSLSAEARKGLIVYYSFDGDEETKVADQSGRGNDAHIVGARLTCEGKVGKAYASSGSRENYLTAGLLQQVALTNVSLVAWVKMERAEGNPHPVGKAGAYALQVVSGRMRWAISTTMNEWGSAELYADGVLRSGEWTHVAGVYDGDKTWLYVDGVRQTGSVRASGPISYSYGGGRYFMIGAEDGTGHAIGNSWEGAIDEVMVFDRALSGTEVQQLHDAQK